MQKYFYILLIALFATSCRQNESNELEQSIDDTNIQKFEFNDWFITFETLINDTIHAKAIFETGVRDLQIDRSFFNKYLNTGQKKELRVFAQGFSYKKDTGYLIKNYPIKIQIGEKYIIFNEFYIFDFKKHELNSDILFPIPIRDSLIIWELNLENKYIKLHDYGECIISKGYDSTNIYMNFKNYMPNDILFNLPIKYLSSDNKTEQDTLICLFDTGNPLDILVWNNMNAIEKIKTQKLSDGLLGNNRVKIFRTKASFFNQNIQDSSSIRFFQNPEYAPYCDLVGLNFIVRFNYFIDLYNKKLYYKQIKKPTHIYFIDGYETIGAYCHYDTELNMVIDSIGTKYAQAPCARAGAKAGDKIIWFCGYSCKELVETRKDFRETIHNSDGYHFRVVRNGDTLNLTTNKIW